MKLIIKISLYILLFILFGFIVVKANFAEDIFGIRFSKKTNTDMTISLGNLQGESRKKENSKYNIFLKNYHLKNVQENNTEHAELFTEYKNGNISKKIYKLSKYDKFGLVDENGKSLTKYIYDDILIFDENEGVYETKIGLKSGLINYDGRVLLPTKFEDIQTTKNSNVILVKNTKYFGLYDYKNTSFIASPIYLNIKQTDSYNWKIYSGKLVGIVYSKNGNSRLISPKYEEILLYKGVYKTYNEGKIGLISDKGKIISDPSYDSIELINEIDYDEKNLMIFRTKIDNRFGIIYYTPYELTIVSPIYADVQYKGLVNVLSDGYWRILDNKGNVIKK